MSFEWGDFLDYVKKNCSNVDDECTLRIGVSRAYYAAYHCAKKYLLDKKIVADGYVKHEEVWMGLKSTADAKVRNAGLAGNRLKAKRVNADYDGNSRIQETDLIVACKDADDIINACS